MYKDISINPQQIKKKRLQCSCQLDIQASIKKKMSIYRRIPILNERPKSSVRFTLIISNASRLIHLQFKKWRTY